MCDFRMVSGYDTWGAGVWGCNPQAGVWGCNPHIGTECGMKHEQMWARHTDMQALLMSSYDLTCIISAQHVTLFITVKKNTCAWAQKAIPILLLVISSHITPEFTISASKMISREIFVSLERARRGH